MRRIFRWPALASFVAASVVGGIACHPVNAAVIELITNGDFSNASPAISPTGFRNTVTSLPGWSTSNPDGQVFTLIAQGSNQIPTTISGTGFGAALSLRLPADGNNPYVYSQTGTVPLGVVVESVTFSFYTTVYWDGETRWSLSGTSGSLLSGTANASYGSWLLVSNTLSSAQAASLQPGEHLTVSFTTNSQNNLDTAYIDNVSLQLVTTAVPEPGMLAGLGVIGGWLTCVLRRRFQAAKSAN